MALMIVILSILFSRIFSTNVCPEGFYCTGTCQILDKCTVCPVGSYCYFSDGHGNKAYCLKGHYCPSQGMASPTDCLAGTYQDTIGQTSCKDCTVGHYCDSDSMISPSSCKVGTYQPYTKKTSCQDCLKGYYCDETGMSTVSGKRCTKGNYCPTGSIFQVPCTAGDYCSEDGLSETSGKCQEGYFCPQGSISATQNVCPDRQYCPEGSIQPEGCPCPANDNVHGNCTHETNPTCFCDDGYGGSDCGIYTCYGIDQNSQEVCSGNGFCGNIDDCQCYQNYNGKECEEFYCFGILQNDSTVCNGHGKCKKFDQCICEGGWSGDECSSDPLLTAMPIVLSVSIIVILICCCIIVAVPVTFFIVSQRKKLKFFGKFKDEIEILNLEEQARKDNTSASFSISKKFFTIDYRDIKLKKLIGKGGYSEVFLCEWVGQMVALKRFQTSSLGTKEQNFKDFEKELGLLSSISHPNIINFYGATLNPPRVGILLEYCPTDLSSRIEYKKKKITFYKKMVWCEQIASGVLYLHKRDIIHRDLKLENILLNKSDVCKLCDFGLSKVVEKSNIHHTKCTGTSFYMAPEVTLGNSYDKKVDVFSFAIIMYCILVLNPNPYHHVKKNEYNAIEINVARKNLRPELDGNSSVVKKCPGWYIELMQRCWKNEPKLRPDMYAIQKKFKEEIEKEDTRRQNEEVDNLMDVQKD